MDNEELLNNDPSRVSGDDFPPDPFLEEQPTPTEIANEILDEIGMSEIPYEQYYYTCLNIYIEKGYDTAKFNSVYSIIKESPQFMQDYTEGFCYDYLLPYNFNTGVIDYSTLDIIENGIYKVAVGIDVYDKEKHNKKQYIVQLGSVTCTVTNDKKTQTVVLTPLEPSANGSPFKVHYRVTNISGTEWYEYDYDLPVINDGELINPTQATDITYSRAKIDSLIAALDERITALEPEEPVE